mmetsp:Transcript_13828/g.32050  ORF Transcript_13828/g.32050 Transcript_13828/m.32050 type:complete len:211 (-) Transcript_13828:1244-1876(-)
MGTAFLTTLPMADVCPMPPPTKTSTPSTCSPALFLALEPRRPMSPICTWPHVLVHPVQWMRTLLPSGNSYFLSMRSAISMALPLVLMLEKPQNWLPVHDTVPFWRVRGAVDHLGILSAISLRAASRFSSDTWGIITFSSTIILISPLPYLSAMSAKAVISSPYVRPAGTCTPIQLLPSFCLWAPMRSRRSHSLGTRPVPALASSSPVEAL